MLMACIAALDAQSAAHPAAVGEADALNILKSSVTLNNALLEVHPDRLAEIVAHCAQPHVTLRHMGALLATNAISVLYPPKSSSGVLVGLSPPGPLPDSVKSPADLAEQWVRRMEAQHESCEPVVRKLEALRAQVNSSLQQRLSAACFGASQLAFVNREKEQERALEYLLRNRSLVDERPDVPVLAQPFGAGTTSFAEHIGLPYGPDKLSAEYMRVAVGVQALTMDTPTQAGRWVLDRMWHKLALRFGAFACSLAVTVAPAAQRRVAVRRTLSRSTCQWLW